MDKMDKMDKKRCVQCGVCSVQLLGQPKIIIKMHWISCGLIIFGFSSPSAITGIPFAFGSDGLFVGIFFCIFFAVLSSVGSFLVLDLACKYESIKEFKDMGKVILGSNGANFGTLVQNGNCVVSHWSIHTHHKTFFFFFQGICFCSSQLH